MKRLAVLACLLIGACDSVWRPFINYHGNAVDGGSDSGSGADCVTRFCPETSPTPAELEAIWGFNSSDIWVVGSGADFLHYDGAKWTKFFNQDLHLYGIWGSGPQDVWAVAGGYWHFLGNGPWTMHEFTIPTLHAIWGTGAQDVWVTGEMGVLNHWDGATWTPTPPPAGLSTASFSPIWGSRSDDVWSSTGNTMVHWDGSTWSAVPSPAQYFISSIWGSSAQDVWAVSLSVTMHWDGTAWTTATIPESVQYTPLWGLWGSSQRDVWAVGSEGTIMHFDGATWSVVPSGTTTELNAVWGDGRGNLWIVGQDGLILYHRYAA